MAGQRTRGIASKAGANEEQTRTAMAKARSFLRAVPLGPVDPDVVKQVIQLLTVCWNVLDGSDETAVSARKLHRVECCLCCR